MPRKHTQGTDGCGKARVHSAGSHLLIWVYGLGMAEW